MELFFASAHEMQQGLLSEEETRHAVKVLRKQKGNAIAITDGQGRVYRAVITEITKKQCFYQVVDKQQYSKNRVQLIIAIAPPKNAQRWDFFLEKSVELGVDAIFPLHTR